MGFTGTFVLCRATSSLDAVQALVTRNDGLESEDSLRDDWKLGIYYGHYLFADRGALLRDLVTETGSPVLTAYVDDSDFVQIDAVSPTGAWTAYLCRRAAALELNDAGDRSLPSPDDSVLAAQRWAHDAGFAANTGKLRSLFQLDRGGLAEDVFSEFLDALVS